MLPIFKHIFRYVALLIGGFLVLLALLFAGAWYLNSPPPTTGGPAIPGITFESGGTVLLEVPQGQSADALGIRLQEAGLIRSRIFWNLLFRLDKRSAKAGTYRFEVPASQLRIHTLLVTGRQLLQRVTIPEGSTLKKIGAILEEAGVCTASDFLAASENPTILQIYDIPAKTMEGYLYPDTYLFPRPYAAEKIVKTMADTLFKRLKTIAPEAATMTNSELFRRIVIASIVEREYRADDEAPLIAGVFFNRLKIGMGLQSCATVEYVITEIEGKPHPEVLYNKDIAIKDPYNTYVYAGLPPGPISCPGAVALNAAFHPTASDYLYFRLMDPQEGRHKFSKTLEDHIKAGVFYVKRSSTTK